MTGPQMIAAHEFERRRLVGLFWLYLALLIGEGALRKWVLPGFSDALLVARDPIAAVILVLAIRGGFLVVDGLTRAFTVLAVSLAMLATFQLATGQVLSAPVLLFGLRTYLLHPPLIFVIGRVFTGRDLRHATLAVMILMVPVALLMVQQFNSAATDWINAGAGEGRNQLRSALGHVRPAGPFSFISGPILLFSLGLACLMGAHFGRGRDLTVARYAGWTALIVASAVSGSRSFIISLAPVAAAAITAAFIRPQVAGRFVRGAITAGFIVTLIWSSAVMQDGLEVFDVRLLESGGTQDLVNRSRGTYVGAIDALGDAPLFGYGLGLGTNAGNALLGADAFRLGEEEWSRVILEAGPILGLSYLLWRFWLVAWLIRIALRAASFGYVLPILLLGACAMNLISGNWGQPTTQGFAVWSAGMAVAACRVPYRVAAASVRAMRVGVVGDPVAATI